MHFHDKDVAFALLVGGRHPDLTRIVCKYIFDARSKHSDGEIDYQVISNQVLVDFEAFCINFWPEIETRLRSALSRLVTETTSDMDEDEMAELAALGSIVREGSRFSLFSPISEQFLQREKAGSGPIVFVASPRTNMGQMSIPAPRVFIQGRRKLQLVLYVPLVVIFASLTTLAALYILGQAQVARLLHTNNAIVAVSLVIIDFLVVGILMWRILLLLEARSANK